VRAVTTSFAAALAAGPVVLDGGLASQLEEQGADLSGALWSARVLRDDPAAVLAAHRAFFAAGAEVATTASYQASVAGLVAAGLDQAQAVALLRRSVALAADARAEVADDGRQRWVAASVGPYGAFLADGSEYRGDYAVGVAELRAFHRPQLQVLAESGADVLACETVPCLREVEALVAELDALGFPAWLSVSAAGDRTRAGEPLADAFAMARGVPAVVAVGVNCCAPAGVERAVPLAVTRSGRPGVAYPNAGESWDPAARTWTGPSSAVAAPQVRQWVAAGARLVGGCCRVSPAQIAQLAAVVTGAGQR
jgi:S-methylmethionine-dependent homocysteine/selenocysteine methylase